MIEQRCRKVLQSILRVFTVLKKLYGFLLGTNRFCQGSDLGYMLAYTEKP